MIGKLPESAGNNLGPQLDRFEADFGFHGAPWCGIFAGHVLEAARLSSPTRRRRSPRSWTSLERDRRS